MCTYSITLNDMLIEKARPAFDDENALQQWLQEQVSIALEKYIENTESEQHVMVKESLTKAFNEFFSHKYRAFRKNNPVWVVFINHHWQCL